MRRRNNKKSIIALLFLNVLCLSIGFAIFNSNLSIAGSVYSKGNTWNVYLDNIQVKTGSVSATTPKITNKTSISYSVSLSDPGDFYEFSVDVVNKGTIDAMVDGITMTTLSEAQKKYLEFSVTYSNGNEIKKNDYLEASVGKKTLKVLLSYKEGVSRNNLPEDYDTSLSLNFKIDYIQNEDDINNYAKLSTSNCTYNISAGEGEFPIVCDNKNFRTEAYLTKIKTLTFENSINVPDDAIAYWDIGEHQNDDVMAYLKERADNYYDLYIQSNKPLMANENMSYWFAGLSNLDKINNINLLDVSNVDNMLGLFALTGYLSPTFTLDLGNNFDTAQVTNMSGMFLYTGYLNPSFTLNLGNKFNTCQVLDMSLMFLNTGYSSTVYTLNLGDKFDTSRVTNMNGMFSMAGHSSPVFTLNLGNKFDTSNVVNMAGMFGGAGYVNTSFTLNLGNKFDTSNVIDMTDMFSYTGDASTVFTLDLGSKFNTSKVTSMKGMFWYTGESSPVFTLNLGSEFDTSNVTDMSVMFFRTGYSSTVFTLDLGSKFNTSKVTSMHGMFTLAGATSPVFNLNIGSKFDTSKVTNMEGMFSGMGCSSSVMNFSIAIKGTVTSYDEMFKDTALNGSRITVNYTSSTSSLVDNMIATKSSGSSVIKGNLIS